MQVLFKLMGNKRLFVLLIGVILSVAFMGLTLGKKTQMTWPEKFVEDSVSFAQGIFYKPAGYIAGFFEDLGELKILYEENKALKKKLAQYAQDTTRLNALEVQNQNLEEALEFTDRQKLANRYTWHVAEVVAQSPDPLNNTLTINLGSKDGMAVDMAVATVDGLIGRIQKVSSLYSTVQLITDIEANQNSSRAIAATAAGKEGTFGMIENYDRETGHLIMNKIPDSDKLEVGDTIVTSGLGEVFPKGVVIGRIDSIKVGDFGITYTASIKPAANFNVWREVFVIEVPKP